MEKVVFMIKYHNIIGIVLVLTILLSLIVAYSYDNITAKNKSLVSMRYSVMKRPTTFTEVKSLTNDIVKAILEGLNVSILTERIEDESKPEEAKKNMCLEKCLRPYKYYIAPVGHVIAFGYLGVENETIDKLIYEHTIVGKDVRFWKLYSIGYVGITYLKPLRWLNYFVSIRGRYLYNQLNVSGQYNVWAFYYDPDTYDVSISLWNFIEVFRNGRIAPRDISNAIANAVLEWYYENVLRKVFDKTILSRVRMFPSHIPSNASLDLVNLEPPLPKTTIVSRLSNGSLLILRIRMSEPAHAMFIPKNLCLIEYRIASINSTKNLTKVLENRREFKCLLHLTRRGLTYYIATGNWDPWKVFNETEYHRYLELLKQLNKTNISLNTNVSRYVYGNDSLIVGPFFYIYVRFEGFLGGIADFNVHASLPIIVGYRDVRIHYSVEELKEYLVRNCRIARLLAEKYGDISIVEPSERFSQYIGFSIDALEEALNITMSLYKKYYWDNTSRRLLDVITNATLANSFNEAWKLYTLLSTWSRILVGKMLGEKRFNATEYIVLLPTYTIGEAMDYPWWKAFVTASYIAEQPIVVACVNLTELALEFKEIVEGITSNNTSTPMSQSIHSTSCSPNLHTTTAENTSMATISSSTYTSIIQSSKTKFNASTSTMTATKSYTFRNTSSLNTNISKEPEYTITYVTIIIILAVASLVIIMLVKLKNR